MYKTSFACVYYSWIGENDREGDREIFTGEFPLSIPSFHPSPSSSSSAAGMGRKGIRLIAMPSSALAILLFLSLLLREPGSLVNYQSIFVYAAVNAGLRPTDRQAERPVK